MDEFWKFVGENWGWAVFILIVFGGSIAEWMGGTIGSMASAVSGRSKFKVQLKAKDAQLRAKDAELERAHALLTAISGGSPPVVAIESASTAARMARLLGLVQGADTAWPQLADNLRDQIDEELTAYHTAPVPRALEGKARRKGKS